MMKTEMVKIHLNLCLKEAQLTLPAFLFQFTFVLRLFLLTQL